MVRLFSPNEQQVLERFAKDWVYRLLQPWVSGPEESMRLDQYHIWSKELPQNHRDVFGSKNRYIYPDSAVRATIINERLRGFIESIGIFQWSVWDDGWGDVGFRLIRPGMNDGYPLCCKEWGKAKGALSFWLPIIGHSKNETLLIARGSHQKEYPRKTVEGKFYAHEPRFVGDPSQLDLLRPELHHGEAIAYSSRTLHSEDVTSSSITRLNLEIRFIPK